MILKNALLLLLAGLSGKSVAGFMPSITGPKIISQQISQSRQSTTSSVILNLTPEEERAAVLSDYLAKSHEEKLKAIAAVEAKKNAEIAELKEQLKQTGSVLSSPPAPAADAVTATLTIAEPPVDPNLEKMSQQHLVALVRGYKHFVANYVADAEKQKADAVKAAEEALTEKYEAKLAATARNADVAPQPPAMPPTGVVKAEAPRAAAYAATSSVKTQTNDLYAKRNARVTAAASAGKSRWGNQEVHRVATGKVKIPEKAMVDTPTPAERTPSLYDKRNIRLAAAAKSGKSRWGEMENERVLAMAGDKASNAAQIEAADHGLRADGGVSGPSLAERVNQGFALNT